jgi:hypothetical protein
MGLCNASACCVRGALESGHRRLAIASSVRDTYAHSGRQEGRGRDEVDGSLQYE